jgi:hypothetical protein
MLPFSIKCLYNLNTAWHLMCVSPAIFGLRLQKPNPASVKPFLILRHTTICNGTRSSVNFRSAHPTRQEPHHQPSLSRERITQTFKTAIKDAEQHNPSPICCCNTDYSARNPSKNRSTSRSTTELCTNACKNSQRCTRHGNTHASPSIGLGYFKKFNLQIA